MVIDLDRRGPFSGDKCGGVEFIDESRWLLHIDCMMELAVEEGFRDIELMD